MTREIKFRAWDGVEMLYRSWNDRNWYNADGKQVMVALPEDAHRLKVGEYTNLRDKNGVEIYEGDILEYVSPEPQEDDDADRYVVEWEGYGFVANWHHPHRPTATSDGHLSLKGVDEDMLVIGNHYEHPELLK